MRNKYDEAWDHIVFIVAGLLFGEPILEWQQRIVDDYLRFHHLWECVQDLRPGRQNPAGIECERTMPENAKC